MRKQLLIILISIMVLFSIIVPITIISVAYPIEYKDIVEKYASEYNIDKSILFALIKTESNFKANAISSAGARGLMQLLPSTAKEIAGKLNETFSVDSLYSVNTNVKYGTYYLRYLLNMFDGDYTLSIASFNAGFSNVKAWLKDTNYSEDGKTLKYIPFKETREYVKKINFAKKIYRAKLN